MTKTVIALAMLFSLICLTSCQLGSSFGESCDDEVRCDPRALLSCINNTCECIKPKEMTFNTEKNICVVKLGGTCVYSPEEKLDCVDTAVCKEGRCECKNSKEEYENSDGICIPKGVEGSNCTTENQCRTDKFLFCDNGVCSCNLTTSVFDPDRNKCVGLEGTSCIHRGRSYSEMEEPCVRNGYCTDLDRNKLKGTCRCHRSFLKTNNGRCVPVHGMSCSASNPCSDDFSCIDGTCKCHFPDHQLFYSGQCVSYVRGPCLELVDGTLRKYPCMTNTECKNSSGVYQCDCRDGWVESYQRICRPGFGQKCSNSESSTYLNRRNPLFTDHGCDRLSGLVCRNNKCSCPDLQVYEPISSKCRGMVGAKCRLSDGDFCINGAYCDKYRDQTDTGVCRCKFPLYPASDRRKCSYK